MPRAKRRMSANFSKRLIIAVAIGDLEGAKVLIDSVGLSCSVAWGGYNLLLNALDFENEQMAKLLLKSGSKVNGKRTTPPSHTPLHMAVKCGYTEIVSMLLERKADVNARSSDEITPLHLAIRYENLEIAEKLLSHGAFVNAQTIKNYTPLHDAVSRKECLVQLLLSKGADINAVTRSKETPLYLAITSDASQEVIKLLLESGANVDSVDEYGSSILYAAASHRTLEVVELVLKYHPNVNSEANRSSLYSAIGRRHQYYIDGNTIVESLLRYGFTVNQEDAKNGNMLHSAVKVNCLEMLEALLKLGADVNERDETRDRASVLHTAALYNRADVVALLLRNGANRNDKDDYHKLPIDYAISRKNVNIVKLLWNGTYEGEKVEREFLNIAVQIDCGTGIVAVLLNRAPNLLNATDVDGKTALHHTVLNRGCDSSSIVNVVNLLISRGACVNAGTKDGMTALHMAAGGDSVKVVEILLANKANVDARGSWWCWTPLHSAARNDKPDIIKVLLDNGANINAKANNGYTALHRAIENGNIEVIKVLLDNGVDINAKNDNEYTALHQAIGTGSNDVVKILLDNGANVNATDNLGTTALHEAIQRGRNDLVNLLVRENANLNALNKFNYTPLHYAVISGDHRIVETLLSLGATIDARSIGFGTALHFAVDTEYLENECHKSDIVKVLLDYGADINATDEDSMTPLSKVYRYIHKYNDVITTEILENHIIALMAINFYVSEANLRYINLHFNRHDIVENCQKEIVNTKTQKIGNSIVTFYDVLTGNINQLVGYARNKSIVEALESKNLNDFFPTYSRMMTRRIRQGEKRQNLLHLGHKSLNALSGYFLPDLSAIELSNYLCNDDLENLINAHPKNDDCNR